LSFDWTAPLRWVRPTAQSLVHLFEGVKTHAHDQATDKAEIEEMNVIDDDKIEYKVHVTAEPDLDV